MADPWCFFFGFCSVGFEGLERLFEWVEAAPRVGMAKVAPAQASKAKKHNTRTMMERAANMTYVSERIGIG